MQGAIGTSSPGERRGRTRVLLLAALVLTTVFCVAAASASALTERGYVFQGSFGSEGTGSGQMKSPQGVAVNDKTGDVYIVDAGNNRVDRFKSNGEFIEAWGVGVNTSGSHEYEQCTTKCLAGRPARGKGGLHNAKGIAIDNDPGSPSYGDVYVEAVTSFEEGETEFEGGIYDKFTSTGTFIALFKGFKAPGESTELFEEPHGLTVDALGEFIVYNEETAVYFTGEEKNKFLRLVESEVFGDAREGIATDAAGDIYFGVGELVNEPASPTVVAKTAFLEGTEETSTLIGALDPENTTGFAVDPKTQNVFLDNVTSVAMVSSEGELIDRFGNEEGEAKEQVLTSGSGLATGPDKAEPSLSDVYVADAAKGVLDVFVPEPAGAPRIDELAPQKTTATSTELAAKIDPHGEASEYFFRLSSEAVPTAGSPCTAPCVEAPVPPGAIGSAGHFGDLSTSPQKVEGLSPFTTYRYKLIARNAKGTVESPEQKVRTLPTTPGTLPDHRGFAVASQANKNGGYFEAATKEGGEIQAAAAGDAITYVSSAALPGAEGNRAPEVQQILSTRHENAGKELEWHSESLTTPTNSADGFKPGAAPEYQLFSTDLSQAIVKPFGGTQVEDPELTSEASERTVYLRHNFTCASSHEGCYTALVNDLNDTGLSKGAKSPYGSLALQYAGSNSSLAFDVIKAEAPLTPEPTLPETSNLYEVAAGEPGHPCSGASCKPTLVNVLPNGKPSGTAHLGGPLGQEFLVRNAISEDGSRVIWNDNHHLYVREMPTATSPGRTAQVDAPHGVGEELVENGARFQTASSDGKTIFFSDDAKLVPGAKASFKKPDLYVCELIEGEGGLECKLTDLTASTPGSEAGWVQGAVPGVSGDGSVVYFVADGVLAPGAKPGDCLPGQRESQLETEREHEATLGNTCSLYVDRRSAGGTWETPEVVAEVSAEDEPDWAAFSSKFNLSHTTSRPSPDGQWFAFMSDRNLTGYNNHDVVSGKADEEVFLYSLASHKLVCASCDPTGARPQGAHDIEESGEGIGLLVDRRLTWVQRWLAASVPGWTGISVERALYQSRYLSNSGRLFFNSSQPLATQDHNHAQDVYEFEPIGILGPDGAEACTGGSETFSEAAGGCIALISGGGPEEKESAFLDASENGNDVFFDTAQPARHAGHRQRV